MLTDYGREVTEDVEFRRHNGQCEYGPWMDADEEDLPIWARGMVADRIIEEDESEGIVSQGGCSFAWRKAEVTQ